MPTTFQTILVVCVLHQEVAHNSNPRKENKSYFCVAFYVSLQETTLKAIELKQFVD